MDLISTPKTFPNESAEYRKQRNDLLQAEMALRAEVERVAKLRQALPLGGRVKEDYVFQGPAGAVKLSEMFGDKNTLLVYSYMFGPKMAAPCPSCTSLIDGLDASLPNLEQRVALAVVAKSPLPRILEFATDRGWRRVRLYSSAENAYNADYFGEDERGNQMPMMNVFVRNDDGIFHFWGTEMLYAVKNGDARHMDMAWPLWNLLDMTPEGRGTDWYPRLTYQGAQSPP